MGVRVGDRGKALTPMTPSGKVSVGGVTHDARSEYGHIPAGSECVVVRGDLTGLVVRPVEPGREPAPLPNHGEEAIRKGEAQRTAAEAAEAERRERAEARRAELHRLGAGVVAAASLGAMVGLAAAGLGPLLGWVPADDPGNLALLLGGGLVAGLVWSVVLFFVLGGAGRWVGLLTEGDEATFAPSFLVLFGALVGTAVGAWWGYTSGGWESAVGWGVGWAAVVGVTGGLVHHLAGTLAD